MSIIIKKPLEHRFSEKIGSTSSSDCWPWVGARVRGLHGHMDKTWIGETVASRISWILFKGKIPKGLFVLHKCDNPPCVNPNHLFLGTQQDNVDDMWKKGRANNVLAKENLKKTHCPQGHPYAGDNLYVYKNNRMCKQCLYINNRNRKLRIRHQLIYDMVNGELGR